MYRTILVPLDGSTLAEEALPIARRIAQRTGATLRLARVHGHVLAWGSDESDAGSRSIRDARTYLDDMAARLAVDGGPETTAVQLEGPPPRALCSDAREHADLIVMTTHGKSGFSRVWLGSTAEAVARHAPVPVLVVRPAELDDRHAEQDAGAPVFRHILVPIEGSAASDRALDRAMEIGLPLGSCFTLLAVVASEQEHAMAAALLERAASRIPQDVPVKSEVRVGPPARTILHFAAERDVDLIAVCSRGGARIGRLLRTRTADRVLRGAEQAVLMGGRPVRARRGHLEPHGTLQLDRIVVAIDFGAASVRAANWVASDLAPGAELVLAHVADVPHPPHFLRGAMPPNAELETTVLHGAAARLRNLGDSLPAHRKRIEVRPGRPANTIAAIARDTGADLIVVGEHGPRPLPWGLLGSTAERLLLTAPAPVLLARGVHGPPTRILVPVDDSPTARRALRCAAALRDRFGATLIVQHVITPAFANRAHLISAPVAQARFDVQAHAAADAWLHQCIASEIEHPANAETLITFGSPALEILGAADRSAADLIVIGSCGAEGFAHRLLGSTARAIVTATHVPVLVVGCMRRRRALVSNPPTPS